MDAPWIRPSLLILLAATTALYVVGLGGSGWANSFYSAAVQAGSTSWKAFFYGSSDAANSITPVILALVLIVTAIWSYVLLNRSAEWESWLRYFVLIGGIAGAGSPGKRFPPSAGPDRSALYVVVWCPIAT